jgi:hypothetical protein
MGKVHILFQIHWVILTCTVLLRSAVTDGITIGHPCCRVHDCKEPLPNMKARYCIGHTNLELRCSTIGCPNMASHGYHSCPEPECRELERAYYSSGTAMFQLRQRLARQGLSHPQQEELSVHTEASPGIANDPIQENNEIEIEVDCVEGRTGKTKRLRGRFGRLRTHCEVLCVLSCGTILGRTTMFGSEAPNGIIVSELVFFHLHLTCAKEFWHRLFPTAPSLPTFLWYDNNCHVKKVLVERDPDDLLHQVALPVDVFHFKSKHKETDAFCGMHCNPALWPELMTNGRWTFNSSAAEQTNVWMGGYLSITREMRSVFFNFFLDEMIRRRNEWNIRELERKGYNPRYIRYDHLFPDLFPAQS